MHVIIVSYYFPPLGLAGTMRPVAMANFFASKGARVSVVTVKEISYPVYDESMQMRVDPRVEIVRVGSNDPARFQRFIPFQSIKNFLKRSAKGFAKNLLFPDSKIGFARFASQGVAGLLQENSQAVLITSSPPVSSHLVGLEHANNSKVIWVADFRDIWTSVPPPDDNIEVKLRAESLTKDIVSKAAIVTATSPKTYDTFSSMYGARDKAMFLPNGFAERDFAGAMHAVRGQIGIFGTINSLVGFDRVIAWLGEYSSAREAAPFELHHTGYSDLPDLESLLKSAGLKNNYISRGYLPHDEAVGVIRSNDINLVALTDKCDTSYVVPSKLWELLRAEPPLIAVLPKGNAARRFLEEKRFAGVWVTDSRSAFVAILDDLLKSPEKYRGLRSPQLLQEFEWTSKLERLRERIEVLHR